ncbi:MAG: hypothetical protein J6C97_03110, partial [Clostridia bacterium]|nr:hypothetical protein [Clostridia bacterium]
DSNDKANGIYFYADAACPTGQTTDVTKITGNNFAYANRVEDAFQWDVTKGGTYSASQVHKLAVYRQGSIFKFIVDDNVLFTATFALGASVYPAIFSFSVGLEVTNYSITSDINDENMKKYYVETSSSDGAITGLTFGDANLTIKQQGTWSLGVGSGSSTGSGESYTWSTTVGGKSFYFEADVKAGTPINGDKYPKVGLILRTPSTELFFCIDAINGGDAGNVTYGTNNWVGYGIRQTGNAIVGAWDFSAQFVPVAKMLYTGGNAAKMGIWLENATNIHMLINGQIVLTASNVPGLSGDTVNASVGVMGWGMTFSFENALAKADTTSLAALNDLYGITDSANGITVDANITDWKGSKLSYYEAKGTDAVRGFKVSSYMGTNGVYVLYQGITSTIGTAASGSGDWWKNLNVEMRFYTSTGVQTDVRANVKKYAENAFVHAFKYTQRTDNMYNVIVELFVPYAVIGYTGTEEYVAGFFAFRPNENEVCAGINGGDNEVWWYGTVHPHQQSYAAASTTYKITKNGLVGSKVTVMS